MRLITQKAGGDLLGVSDRTIRNMISRGDLTGYMIPGLRAVRVDRDVPPRRMKMCRRARSVVEVNAGAADEFLAAGLPPGP